MYETHFITQTVPKNLVACLDAGLLFVFDQHFVEYLELECTPIKHVPWSEAELVHVFLDFAG